MKYGLSAFTEFYEISKEEFDALNCAREGILAALRIEENFDLVLENYVELEIEAIKTTTKYMVFNERNHNALHLNRVLINRRIVNFLTGCRIYIDHKKHHLKNIFTDDPDPINEIDRFLKQQYRDSLPYQAMEELRNHVQHRGLPIHTISYGSFKTPEENLKFSNSLHLDPSELEIDGKFKKSVLEKLKASDQQTDLKHLIRKYTECLGRIHQKVRDLTNPNLETWDVLVKDTVENTKNKLPEKYKNFIIFAAIKIDDDQTENCFPLLCQQIEFRKNLEAKNRNLDSLSKRFLTTEIEKD